MNSQLLAKERAREHTNVSCDNSGNLKRAKAHAAAASRGPNVRLFVTSVKEPIVVEMPRQVGVRPVIQAI